MGAKLSQPTLRLPQPAVTIRRGPERRTRWMP